MNFGVVLQTDPPAREVVRLAKHAESRGFTHLWVYDSHLLWQEPFAVLTQVLAQTEHLIVGPMVTNPGTRDWTLLASTFATLNDTFGPRTLCGMGSGDSALRTIGRNPCSLAEMAEAIKVVRGLVSGDIVRCRETDLRLPWVEDGWRLPVWGAGYGPKALACIAHHADGFILQLADPQILQWMKRVIEDTALGLGRDMDAFATCIAAPAYVGPDLAHQHEQLRWFGGMVGNHVADIVRRYGFGEVPRALTDYIKAREGYDYSHHGRAGNPDTAFVPDEVIDRFCVLGEASAHVAKLRALQNLGADHFAIYLMHDAKEATLDAYGEEIIPTLTATES